MAQYNICVPIENSAIINCSGEVINTYNNNFMKLLIAVIKN